MLLRTTNHFSGKFTRLAIILILQLLVLTALLPVPAANAQVIMKPDWTFLKVWERTDWPVALGATARSWYWGPAPFSEKKEFYYQSAGFARQVQYWDKSRMEITYPTNDRNSKWFVTNGLLVREMVSGYAQYGDNPEQSQYIGPAKIQVSGDPIEYNPDTPTYASFGNLISLNRDKRADKKTGAVTTRLDKNGTVTDDSGLASTYPETSLGYYENTLGHNIPAPFWNFMNLTGTVMQNRQLSTQPIEDWLFAFGYPISEAYWTRSRVDGVEKDVMVQLFERRALTYTPSNQGGYQVEMANVGRHYYTWRYGSNDKGTAPAYTQPPTRLKIPKIGVDAAIEYAGVDNSGKMEVPYNAWDVSWLKLSTRPGEIGNAVMAGHKDWYNIGPSVFWDLYKLSAGDLITVLSGSGQSQVFKVTSVVNYPSDGSADDLVFGPADTANLNLVTCAGTFNSTFQNYSQRLVVYSTLVNNQ